MPKVSEEHRTARREQIIDAMLRCVAREGFHKTTMADVLAESGLSAGSVYLYFTGKDELIQAITELVAGEGLSIVVGDSDAEVPPPHQMIEATLERVVSLGEERGVELHKVAVQAQAEAARDPKILAIYHRSGQRVREAWVGYVQRAIAAGHLPDDVDPERTAQTLIGLIPGFMVQRLVFEEITPQSYAAGIADLMGCQRGDTPPKA